MRQKNNRGGKTRLPVVVGNERHNKPGATVPTFQESTDQAHGCRYQHKARTQKALTGQRRGALGNDLLFQSQKWLTNRKKEQNK